MAASILVAQERMAIHGRTLWSVVAVLEALAAPFYPENSPLWGPDTD